MIFNRIHTKLLIAGLLLLFHQVSFSQDCTGPLSINLSGSITADSIQAVLLSTDITCASDINGSLIVTVNGGNPSYDFVWDDVSDTDSVRNNLAEGNYMLTITDQEGCTKEVSWDIVQLSAENSDLIMTDGCGNCLLTNGLNSYFFDANNKYIASLTDDGTDATALGDTEVCVEIDDEVSTCNYSSPYLQRYWSVVPSNNEFACIKLFFTQSELDNLASALPGGSTDAANLVANQRLCVAAYTGGDETCDDHVSETIFSTAATPPLTLTLEDSVKGIWSVEVCTDKNASYYVYVCDYALPVDLLYFSGKSVHNGNLLEWRTTSEIDASHFEIERSGDGQNFSLLDKINTYGGDNIVSDYSYLDIDHSLYHDYYRLRMVDLDGSFTYSNIISIKHDIHEFARVYPSIFTDYVYYESTFIYNDLVTILVYNINGDLAHKQNFNVEKGAQKIGIDLDRLFPGTYFMQVSSKKRKEAEWYKLVTVDEK